jgi:hypothetical protein
MAHYKRIYVCVRGAEGEKQPSKQGASIHQMSLCLEESTVLEHLGSISCVSGLLRQGKPWHPDWVAQAPFWLSHLSLPGTSLSLSSVPFSVLFMPPFPSFIVAGWKICEEIRLAYQIVSQGPTLEKVRGTGYHLSKMLGTRNVLDFRFWNVCIYLRYLRDGTQFISQSSFIFHIYFIHVAWR